MTELCVELATAHGGDLDVARRMIDQASSASAHTVKTQHYDPARINVHDPQAAWLRQSALTIEQQSTLRDHALSMGLRFLSTPFDAKSLAELRALGLHRFKVASSEAGAYWWTPLEQERWIVSYPWGRAEHVSHPSITRVTAIPLYPTPLEAVGRAELLQGWSDHTVGLTACHRAIVHGVQYLEVHLAAPAGTLTTGHGRRCVWDKTPEEVRALRILIEDCETIRSGVSQTFRDRWTR